MSDLADGEPVSGQVDGEAILLVRFGDDVRAVGATCTHYGGPLGEGLVAGETVRCPWHQACFSLRTGEALSAPALNPLPIWDVEIRDGVAVPVRRRDEPALSSRGRRADGPESVVIVGAGAAGSAAAEWLRRDGYDGPVLLIDPDEKAPYDRPNLSKDYLAGSAPYEWLPLRGPGFYPENDIERVIERVTGLDRNGHRVLLESGRAIEYGTLLLATGATPRILDVPGMDLSHVHTLRSLDDCRRIIDGTESAERAIVVGAGFIGMEAAASLRQRELDVTVVAPEAVPMERTFGEDLGRLLRDAHERGGVAFRLGRTVSTIQSDRVVLDDDSGLPADLVLVGIGVDPDTRLAGEAGLAVDDGILVDEMLRTDDPAIFAAGDCASWPDPRTGERIRVEHWVVAQRQGQAAAGNILGRRDPYRDIPFFWTHQFDVGISYVGHAGEWDEAALDRGPAEGELACRYVKDGRMLAIATIGRDRLALETREAMAAEAGSPATG